MLEISFTPEGKEEMGLRAAEEVAEQEAPTVWAATVALVLLALPGEELVVMETTAAEVAAGAIPVV